MYLLSTELEAEVSKFVFTREIPHESETLSPVKETHAPPVFETGIVFFCQYLFLLHFQSVSGSSTVQIGKAMQTDTFKTFSIQDKADTLSA